LHTWISRTNGKTSWQDQFKFKWLKRAKHVIACSDAIRTKCWPDALVIANPYKDDSFQILPETSRTKDFIFVGRLVSDKGADLAIKAFHILINKKKDQQFYSNTTLTIIGDGPEKTRLQNLVYELKLDKQIVFKGSLHGPDLVKCLNLHRFILVPSIWEEPFGIVALEGMACGCIPIVSDGGGLPAAVGNAGLVFKSGDANSLASAIEQLLNDPQLEQTLRDAAPVHLENHKQGIISKQYLNVINNSVENYSLAI
jgi:glycosyltransferase involved in cell wall biosynthesis